MNLLSSLLPTNQQQEQPKNKQKSFDFFFCFRAKDYFQIEQDILFSRIKSSIVLSPPFNEVLQNKPDLYGPFWISTTLIIQIIAVSSLLNYLSPQKLPYDFNQISVASFLIYGISFGCPYIIAIIIKLFGGQVSVVDIICIYGYSFTTFIPVTAFCFLKSTLIQTGLLFLGFVFSTIFLIKGIISLVSELGQKQKGVLSAFIIGVQIILVFMYKLYFFDLF